MAVVLVVNDDGDLVDTYEEMLAAMGHKPVTKLTIASGPETVRDVGADALVVDLQSPDDDYYGVRIIEELRGDPEMRNFPIILCSGASEAMHPLRERLDALNVPVLLKPFGFEVLEERLEAALERHRS
jgi:DNA-binding response OmpR family regulator